MPAVRNWFVRKKLQLSGLTDSSTPIRVMGFLRRRDIRVSIIPNPDIDPLENDGTETKNSSGITIHHSLRGENH
jgi:c-di-GMP-binding flagellar brake protein YcgR